jgi:hypothetical protein
MANDELQGPSNKVTMAGTVWICSSFKRVVSINSKQLIQKA